VYPILPCGQMPLPPHSLHPLFRLPCGQMPLPPHSLHRLFRLPCVQTPLPPHSLHILLILPCVQTPLPPHSLHILLILPCVQISLPPQSLHLLFCLPCSHLALFPLSWRSPPPAARFRDAASPVVSFELSTSCSMLSILSPGECGGLPLEGVASRSLAIRTDGLTFLRRVFDSMSVLVTALRLDACICACRCLMSFRGAGVAGAVQCAYGTMLMIASRWPASWMPPSKSFSRILLRSAAPASAEEP
jgi:hypothetical protein